MKEKSINSSHNNCILSHGPKLYNLVKNYGKLMNTSYGSKTCIRLLSLCAEFKPKVHVQDLGLEFNAYIWVWFSTSLSWPLVQILDTSPQLGYWVWILGGISGSWVALFLGNVGSNTFFLLQEFKILLYQVRLQLSTNWIRYCVVLCS